MELRQLEYFVAVAETANFTRAAERVRVSQSGISAQIRQLERELGAPLIDRSSRAAGLTGAGAAALEHARAALAAAQALRRAVDDVNGLVRGRLVVGMVTACTVTGLFDALAGFRRDHPGVEVALVEDHSGRLVELVRTGAADLALIGAGTAPPADLDALVVASERLVATVPPDHPLAGRGRTTLAEVREYPLICMPQGTGIRAVFDDACAARGIEVDIALQATAPAAVADLAARGLGVAVLSESMAAAQRHRLASPLIEDIEEPALLAVVWTPRRAPSPALRALLPHCRRAFGAVSPAAVTDRGAGP